jgi:hypothetical protein
VLASTCWLCCGAHGIFVSILSNDWWVIDAYGKIKEMEKRKACDCSHAILLSSFLLLFFFFLIIRVLLHNSASCVVDKFDPRCRTNYWSWSCTAWNWINPILFSFLSVIDYDHTHVFAFCFVSFIMDEKQEFSFYSMIINILESILMLNQNQFYF